MPASVRHLKHQHEEGKAKMTLFAKWPGNRLFYQVKLLKLNEGERSAYVAYEDGTECWANNSELHLQFHDTSFPYETDDDIVCCVCDDGTSKSPNDIILCDLCQQGYHLKCHNPTIRPSELVKPQWNCTTCEYMVSQYRNAKTNYTSTPVASKPIKKTKKTIDKKVKDTKKSTRVKLPKRSAAKPAEQILDNPAAAAAVDTSSDESDAVVTHKSGATTEPNQPAVTGYTKTIVQKHPDVVTDVFVESIADIHQDDSTQLIQDAAVEQELILEQEPKKVKQAATKTASQESKAESESKRVQAESEPKKVPALSGPKKVPAVSEPKKASAESAPNSVQAESEPKKVYAELKKTRARKAPAAVKAPRGAQTSAPPPA